MSETAVVIDPTGQARQVPADKVDMYVKLGAKAARPVMDPQGQARYVPEEKYMDALGAGGRPYQPKAPAPTLPEASPVSRFLTAAGANLPTPSGLLNMYRAATVGNPTGLGPSGGVVQGFASDAAQGQVAHAVQTQGHIGQDAVNQTAGMAGFNAPSIASDYRNSDYAGLAGDVLTPAAQLLAGMKLARASGADSAPANGSGVNAYAGLLSRGSGLGKNFDPFETASTSIGDVRNAAAANPDIAAQVTKGNPSEYVQGINSLISRAIDPLENFHSKLRAPHANADAFGSDPSAGLAALEDLKNKYPASAVDERSFINDLQKRITQTPNLEDLNSQRKMYGDYASRSYDQTSVQRGESPDAAKAYRAAADGLRQDYYNRLQTLTGVDLRPIMQRESALMDAKQSFASQGSPLLNRQAQATEGGPAVRGIVDRLSKDGVTKGIAGIVRDKMLGEEPVTQPQYLAKKVIGNGGSGSVRRFLSVLPTAYKPVLPGDGSNSTY